MKKIFTLGIFLLVSVRMLAQISPGTDTIVAYRLILQGDSLNAQNEKKQACDSYKKAVNLMSLDQDGPKITQCLRLICLYYISASEFDSLLVYAERGYQISHQLQEAGHPPLEGFCRFKAVYYNQKNQFSEGLYWAQKNLSYHSRNFPDNVFEIAESYGFLGIAYYYTGHIDSSILMFTEKLRLLYTLPQDDPKIQLKIANGLQDRGAMYKELGNYEEAISAYNQALLIAKKLFNEESTCTILYNLGFAYETQNDLDRALDVLQKAREIASKLHGDNNAFHARLLGRLATVQGKLGNFEEATALFQKSNAINSDLFGPDYYEIGINKSNLSLLMLKMGRAHEAMQLARESVEICEKTFAAPHPRKVEAYIILVYAYAKNDIFNDSLVYFSEKAISDVRELLGERNDLASQVWHARSLGMIAFPDHGKEALEAIQEALIATSKQFNSRDIRQNPAPEDFFREESTIGILTTKASILAQLWRIEQRKEHIELALQCLEDGNTMMQRFLRRFGGQTGTDFEALESFTVVCKDGIDFGTAYYKAYPTAENLARCFLWMERDKAQKLLLAAQNVQAKKFAGLPDSLLQQDAALDLHLAQLEKKLLDAETEKDSAAIAQIRDEQLFAAKNERSVFVKDLERNYPTYFSLKYQTTTVDPRKVQTQLSEGDMLLEISYVDSLNEGAVFLYTITRSAQKLLKIPQQKGLSDKIERLNSLLKNPSLAQDSRRKEFIAISSELYAQFIQPIQDQLTGIKKIIIIGEGNTHLLPFEVLLPKNEDKPFQQMDFLIKHFEISYHYSATLWSTPAASTPTFKQELLAFAPVFDQKSDTFSISEAYTLTQRDSSLRAFTSDGDWMALPWTEKEVSNIAQLFKAKGKGPVELLLRENADEKNLKIGLEQGARCIHIASHSFANLQNPKFSGIACSSDKKEPLDGTLYVGEVYNLSIPADLVVLSSCESGKGKLLRTEGPLGLNRAFLYAGVPNVMFTLWKINDRATMDFSNYFYRSMLQGQSYAAALRSAKLEMLANAHTALPMLWSGFLLIGK